MYRNTEKQDGAFPQSLRYCTVELNAIQDSYFDAANAFPSPNASPTTPNAPNSVFSSPFAAAENLLQQQLANIGATGGGGVDSNSTITDLAASSNLNIFFSQQALQLLKQQQQQVQQHLQQQQQQQQIAALALAQRQMALSPASTNDQQDHDEISKSLQMFAMQTAYKAEQETAQTRRINDVMHDFAYNGYASDERSRFQQQYHAMYQTAGNNNMSLPFDNISNNQSNMAFDTHNSIWRMQSSLQPQQAISTHPPNGANATAANGISTNFMNSCTATAPVTKAVNNNTYNNKKLYKRYNGAKNAGNSAIKHCVFCENNNEPEAVVKSHAVRDSQGRVLCPKLRTYICPICKASGDKAHTVKYCPQKPIITMEDAIKAESFRLTKGTFYKQMKV